MLNEDYENDEFIEYYAPVKKPSEIIDDMSDDHTDSSGSLNAYDLIVTNRPLSRKETKEKIKNFIIRGQVAPEPIRKSLDIEIKKKKKWCCWFK